MLSWEIINDGGGDDDGRDYLQSTHDTHGI